MSCIICGKDENVNEQGFCAACAEKLTSLSDSSSALRKLSQNLSRSEYRDSALGSVAGKPTDGTDAKTSSVLFRFGQSEQCSLRYPFSVAIGPKGRIMVLDQPEKNEYRVTIFNPEGNYEGVFLCCAKGDGPNELKYPKGIAIDLHGSLYLPDAGNHRIQRFNAVGACLGPVGKLGQGPGEFDYPCDVEIDEAGCLYVADTYNDRIQKLTPKGIPLLEIGGEQANLDGPLGVTVDEQGNIYVADTNHHQIVKYDSQARQLLILGSEGTGHGEMTLPSDVRVDEDGAIYVADQDNMRIQKFSPEGSFMAEFALSTIMESSQTPEGDIAVDDDGCLILCDKYANIVVKAELYE